jgi:predicted transposase/invertase (TIGR01784 family)
MKIDKWNPSLLESYKKDLQEIREFYSPQIAMDLNAARKEGKAEGIAEGELKGKREMALKMLKKGNSIEDISDLTELSIEEIESLKNKR